MFKKTPPAPASTQAHLPLAGIVEGVVIMRDGSYRAVLRVGATNFMLKSEQEQQALIFAYQNFLNSLNYTIQIVMQSRNLDLEPYLKKLEAKILEQQNELIRQQTEDYVAYVRELITVANIMDKQFYVVVPYTPLAAAKRGLFSSMLPKGMPQNLSVDEQQFARHREELMQRANVVAGGLAALSLKTALLDTDDLIKLYYTVYNYDVAMAERLDKPTELSTSIISTQTVSPPPSPAMPAPPPSKFAGTPVPASPGDQPVAGAGKEA